VVHGGVALDRRLRRFRLWSERYEDDRLDIPAFLRRQAN